VRTLLVHIHHPEMTLWNAPPERIAAWRERFGARGLRVLAAPHDVRFEDGLVEAEILVGHGLTADLFRRAEKLKWIQAPSAGVGHLLFPELVQSPVLLTNARGVHADPMAEHMVGMMLALVRKIHRARDFQNRSEWAQDALWREEPLLDEIGGRTLGIVGLGAIGKALAWRAHALSMRVLGLRRHPGEEPPPGVEEARGPDELPWLLGESDFVANCLPSTPKTKGLLGREAFAAMKPGAYLFNVGRGNTVDEAAMIAAIESGRLAGAGLDVTAEEPLPAESPLYRMPQVLLTFHISGASRRFWDRAAALFEDNVERYLDGRSLRNLVDKKEGY
jgi:phosphoglycerate dehydrogenase-like enzyme